MTVDSVYFWGEFIGQSGTIYNTFTRPVQIPLLGTTGPTPLGAVATLNAENGWVVATLSGVNSPYGFGGNGNNVLDQQSGTSFFIPVPLASTDGVTPYTWPGATLPFVQVDGGNSWIVAIDQAGAVWFWGTVQNGNAGNNNATTSPQPIPSQVFGVGGTGFLTLKAAYGAISGGAGHWVGVTATGTVVACGDNTYGECGDGGATVGTPIQYNVPVAVVTLTNIVAVSAGVNSCASLDSSGNVKCWGRNLFGQLGNGLSGDGNDSTTPVIPSWPSGTPVITGISVGGGGTATDGQMLALDNTGQPWGWGANLQGQLGIGTLVNVDAPTTLLLGPNSYSSGPGHDIVALSSGGSHGLALDSVGHLWGWGQSTFLGDPSIVSNQDTPIDLTYILPTGAVINKIWAGNKCSAVDLSLPPSTQPAGVTPVRRAGLMMA